MLQINILELQKTFDIFLPDSLIELRAVGKVTQSGYFKSSKIAAEQVSKYPNITWYFVMNEINDGCYGREQRDVIIQNPKSTTSDGDITYRNWLLIDSDPERVSGTSASDEEKRFAFDTIGKVYSYLKSIGFSEPVFADSGNGYHLLYKIQLDNNDEYKDLIKTFLSSLDMMFSDDRVKIDTAVFNASRITKLYGTYATKGANTPERPHRKSCLLNVPDEIKPTSKSLIQKVAELIPKPETPIYKNNYSEAFDLRSFLSRNAIGIKKESVTNGVAKYILDHCVFNHDHKSPDAAIFQLANGAIAYKCFHSSCSDRTWQDVRLMFEPNYSKNYRDTNPNKKQAPPNVKTDGYHFDKIKDIQSADRSKIITAKTGIKMLDIKIGGANIGELSIWSGGNGSGKSTVLSQIALDSVQNGFNVCMFSGELVNTRVKYWLYLQAAGRQYTESTGISESYYTPDNIGALIGEWLDDKLWLYNNDYGMETNNLITDFKEHIKKHRTQIVIIDNLMILDMSKFSGTDKYDKQTNLVKTLSDMAKEYNVHIHFVCHPRKPNGFIRKEDISGTGDISNIADNVFICHRVGRDFERLAKEFLGSDLKFLLENKYTNVIEVCKNRDLGIVDHFAGVYFENQSKRMLNERFENKNYCWQDKLQEGINPKWETVDNIEVVF